MPSIQAPADNADLAADQRRWIVIDLRPLRLDLRDLRENLLLAKHRFLLGNYSAILV